MKLTKLAYLFLCTVAIGCASRPQPVYGPPVPMAADNGQPMMQATLRSLHNAKAALETATPNKGGHREAALRLVQDAIGAVQAGMQYAAAHPTEIGPAQGPAMPEPVNEAVPGAERQPHMHQAMVELREAHRQLQEAKGDKGGYRVRGLQLIHEAMVQVREGIQFANRR
jgi:hypothetical protein